MSSSQKTYYLSLNQWVTTDVPTRTDFNYDNEAIDLAMNNHCNDDNIHVTQADREKWDSPYFIGFYYGDGSATRTVDTACPFVPSFGLVFAGGMPPSVADFNVKNKKNYFGFLSKRTSTAGISLSGTEINIPINGNPVNANEYMNFNVAGITYCFVLFR
ncbi:MAG: hypothetical protein K2G22_04550 [Eubacterium sp.]|nr:hypothetical protein [Eubacterium sp.]